MILRKERGFMPLFEILRKTPVHWQPLMGFMDVQGNVVIEPQFLQNPCVLGRHFSDAGYAVVQRPNAKQHLIIDKHGETVFEFPKDHQPVPSTMPDEFGIFGVMHQVGAENSDLWRRDGRDRTFLGATHYYGMRLDGSIAFEAYISQSCHGHYVFSKSPKRNEKMGLMDHKGRIAIPPIYDAIYLSCTDPYATVIAQGRTNVLTLGGSPVFPRSFNIGGLRDLRLVEDGLWVVPNPKTGRADVFDIASVNVIGNLPMFSKICPALSGGFFCITHDENGSTYYRPDGSAAMPGVLGRPRWFKPDMRTGYFYEGRASFKLGEAWGYLDIAGEHVIPPQFYSNLPFRDGLACVKYPADGNSWDRFTYVDRAGAVVWHQDD